MGKNIIFCSDGTRNDPNDKTNVGVTFDKLKSKSQTQVTKYDEGVGNIFGILITGAVFALGLNKNIRDGFKFISDNYESGDKIYLFGFSRGAYTVRSLASLISLCGLAPKNSSSSVIKSFWKVYKKNRKQNFSDINAKLEVEHNSRKATIEAICVWDTVGAVGLKQTRTTDIRKKLRHKFHRMSIYPEINRIYHAVSLDERRTQYWPHLTIEQAISKNTKVEEVWFAGVHSDVGGGYKDKTLSNISLHWMLSKVVNELEWEENGFVESLRPFDPCGKMHNSEGGFIFSLLKKKVLLPISCRKKPV